MNLDIYVGNAKYIHRHIHIALQLVCMCCNNKTVLRFVNKNIQQCNVSAVVPVPLS